MCHTATAGKLLRGVHELRGYVERNAAGIPNYGERYRHGEAISTAMAESTVNQVMSRRFVKRQQMQWTRRGAHLLLQTRTQVLDGELETTFKSWYPRFRPGSAEDPASAAA